MLNLSENYISENRESLVKEFIYKECLEVEKVF